MVNSEPRPDLAVAAAKAISAQLPWLTVQVSGQGTEPSWSLAVLLAAQQDGQDPAARWRAGTSAAMEQVNGVPTPPAVTSAFVLQWLLEVPATAGAYAAALGPWAADPLDLGFDLAPAGHAARIVLGSVTPAAGDVSDRLEAAEAAYREVAVPLAQTFTADAKVGSQQRHGLVRDVWEMAQTRALGSGEVVARESCCFIYALPGMTECAGCPRVATTT